MAFSISSNSPSRASASQGLDLVKFLIGPNPAPGSNMGHWHLAVALGLNKNDIFDYFWADYVDELSAQSNAAHGVVTGASIANFER